MAPSPTLDSPHLCLTRTSENNLQPFFVMHKGSSRVPEQKTRRKIVLSDNFECQKDEDYDEDQLKRLRAHAFDFVWSTIESTVKECLRNIHKTIFNKVHLWIDESFQTLWSCGPPSYAEATQLYPIVPAVSSKQLFTALVFTKNMEFVDDLLTFEDLGLHLKSQGCLVAKLSSLDFSAKNGIVACLRSLLRQFLPLPPDVADLSILASWYNEQRDNKPVVVIIEDMERCCGTVLSDFILMLSEWVLKIPVILIMGVATALDAPRNILPSEALQCLSTHKFVLGSPAEKMNAIVEAILIKPCSWFTIGHLVANFLRNYFLKQDGTLTSFIRALKTACLLHFSTENLSILLKELADEDDCEGKSYMSFQEMMLIHAFDLPSCERGSGPTSEKLASGLAELKRLRKSWGAVVLCVHEALKPQKVQLLDLYCEALKPDPYNSKTFRGHLRCKGDPCAPSMNGGHICGQNVSLSQSKSASEVVCILRALPTLELYELLKIWHNFTEDISEINKKVQELLTMFHYGGRKNSRRFDSQSCTDLPKDTKILNEKAVRLIEWMLRDHMLPIECLPFHEIFCFKDVEKLQLALLGDPRRTVQTDLLESHKFLGCICCSNRGNMLLPSLQDTSIMYILAREHGDIINLHDWYQSLMETVTHSTARRKSRSKHLSSPKERKDIDDSRNSSVAAIQARFCRAVMELQITGLIRMPSKRRPDYVQRVAFGL